VIHDRFGGDVPSADMRDIPMRRNFSHHKTGSNIGMPCMPWMVCFLKLFTKLSNFFPEAVTRAALQRTVELDIDRIFENSKRSRPEAAKKKGCAHFRF